MARWTTRPFIEEVPRLLAERGWSVRTLARTAGVSQPHLSRVLRRADYKSVSGDLASRCARALGVDDAYFIETREDAVVDAIRSDGELRDRLYRNLTRRR